MVRRRQPTQQLEPAAALPARWVSLIGADGTLVRQPLGRRRLRVGSGADADLIVADPHVSRLHCELEPSPAGVLLRDLGSTNGTLVGGAAIREALLAPGVVAVIGGSRLFVESDAPTSALARFGGATSAAPVMAAVFAMLEKLAAAEVTILLTGETGTGKDLLAHAVHDASPRRAGPMVVFDCGAVTASLIESELFGHEKGAFTGAVAERAGAFERAAGGTLFLDEIGELPLELQPRLLRALEQREVRRVGGSVEIAADVRVIAATNRDLAAEVAAGRFRQDLFFRVNSAVVEVPPLRARPEDLALLVEQLLEGRAHATPAAMAALAAYDWPGNVRELRNVVTTALAMLDGPVLDVRHLMFPAAAPRRERDLDELPLAGQSLEAIERAAIKQTLEREGGNRTRAAKVLGIAQSTLYEKLKRYGL
ncbi:MAG: sigma 54-dependent Fis family transcriptional regulator [Myxococcales bacterium]|nr:sigma 54-dependent Fis family transcriptional regulator [Myxococcales bacterium]MBK7195467.1 sigma 54-dependent Fis family transcriptional regulator [Myxococcales bacterium]MBP6844212.1 sigma 54-dependent Fis family transcriptional regulator [Kofleriaceae bacterium]